jgi:hypothetical protein
MYKQVFKKISARLRDKFSKNIRAPACVRERTRAYADCRHSLFLIIESFNDKHRGLLHGHCAGLEHDRGHVLGTRKEMPLKAMLPQQRLREHGESEQ